MVSKVNHNNSIDFHLLQKMNCPYYVDSGYVLKRTQSGPPFIICKRIEISRITRDIDSGEVKLFLSFDLGSQSHTTQISRGQLTRRHISELLRLGLDIPEHRASDIFEWLHYQEKSLEIEQVHSSIGFGMHNNQNIFKLYTTIGCNSKYQGELNLRPKGSFEGWKSIIYDSVIGHTPLELALVLGLAASVSSVIANETGLEVILVHLYGDSSQGKTTAARLAVAHFGYPHISNGGLIKTWNSTSNALLAQLRNINGVPIAIDEASMHDGSFHNFIYLLAGGKDKDRLDKDGALRKAGWWQGLILSTAEHSLLNKSSKNTGLRMRLFEFANTLWTTSAENAEAINHGLLDNYGHSGPVFINYLMGIDVDDILAYWKEWKNYIYSQVQCPDQFTSRLTDKLAVFMVTASYANEALELTLNIDEILQLLLEYIHDVGTNTDLGESAYIYFMQTVVRYRSRFQDGSVDSQSMNEIWGKIHLKNDEITEVSILPFQFERLMSEGSFEDCQVILTKWRDKGILRSDNDGRYTRKRAIAGTNVRVYSIKFSSTTILNSPASP